MLLALLLAVQTAQLPVRVGGNIPPPTKTRDVRPVYPADAQGSGVQGVVILEAVIGPDGKVNEARVIRSIPLLDKAAVDAVKQWEYTPTLLNGTPVPVIMTVTVNFTIQGGIASSPPGYSQPVQTVPPPNPGMIRLTSSMSGGRALTWEITAERAATFSRWNPQTAPPVAMEEAARIAEDSLKARFPDVQRFETQGITFSRVRRSNPDVDFWYYQVDVFVYRTSQPGNPLQKVVVLPDASVLEPRSVEGGSPPPPATSSVALPPGVYRADPAHGVTYPRVVRNVNAEYTPAALQKKISGTVIVEGIVQTDGTIEDPHLEGIPLLDQAAIDAVKQWVYAPTLLNGVPVPVIMTVTVNFTLS